MPETSIVVKTYDLYSTSLKKMSQTTKAFEKDVTSLEAGLRQLSRNKATLRLDLKDAKEELKSAEAGFNGTLESMRRLSRAQIHVDQITRNLKAVTNASKEMEKSISSAENKASGSGGFFGAITGLRDSYAKLQYAQLYSKAIGQGFNAWMGSQYGSTTEGTILSGALSGAASGAAIGYSVGGPWGAAGGALIGLGAGVVSGITQDYENKDDFFKDYYGNLYEERISAGETALTAGSTTAGSREQSYKAFEKRLGTAEATEYLAKVKSMAAQTNYGYDEILGYSKLLLNSYAPEETFGLLNTLSDATAGLNLSSSDVEMFIKGFSRMRTTGKVTQEYLNYFSERGVDVYEALARGTGKDKSQIADMVTRGKIKGADAAEYIVEFLNESYGGLSKELMETYDAKVANLRDVETNVQEGYGTGYNEERKSGIQDKTDTLDGALGGALTEVNELAGFAQGYADNVKDNTWMDVMEAVFTGDTELREGVTFDAATQSQIDQYRGDYLAAYFRYLDAKEVGDRKGMYEASLEVDRIRQQAETLAGEVFGVSDTNKELMDSQKDLMTETRNLADKFGAWAEQYELNQEGTKGRSAAPGTRYYTTEDGESHYWNDNWGPNPYATAWGLDRVPYDNYPALLHQGERVLTAQQAREADRGQGVSVVISGNEFHIREDADVDRVAEALLQKLELAAVRG